ncbi:MAG: hypothetical protein QXZ44_06970 [Ferroplasma sp.]
MNSNRYFYYLKLINNPPGYLIIEYYTDLSMQVENDTLLTAGEVIELESLINNYIRIKGNTSIRVINAVTGLEEEPPRTIIDDFGGNAVFAGKELKYGIEWNVYEPRASNNLFFKKWYYNERVSAILNKTLVKAVPGQLPNYFDTPPWIFGSYSYRGISYIPLRDIIQKAVEAEIIPNKYFLVEKGISRELIDDLKNSNIWL